MHPEHKSSGQSPCDLGLLLLESISPSAPGLRDAVPRRKRGALYALPNEQRPKHSVSDSAFFWRVSTFFWREIARQIKVGGSMTFSWRGTDFLTQTFLLRSRACPSPQGAAPPPMIDSTKENLIEIVFFERKK